MAEPAHAAGPSPRREIEPEARRGGMVAVREYTLMALVTFGPAAHKRVARGYPGDTSVNCVVQPCYWRYFPAAISRDEDPTPPPGVHAVVSIALTDAEAEAFFTPGQRFTIWADAVVGHTVRGDGLVGYGVISCVAPASPPGAMDHVAYARAPGL